MASELDCRISSLMSALELGFHAGKSTQIETVDALEAEVRAGGAHASGVAVRFGALPALTALLCAAVRSRDEALMGACERCISTISPSGGSAASTAERTFRVGETCVIIHELNDPSMLGWHVWSAALRLAKHIQEAYGDDGVQAGGGMVGQRVLELGAGCALCGILAAHYGGNVTLTDIEEPLLENMRLSVAANEMRGAVTDVLRLDWSAAAAVDVDAGDIHRESKSCDGDGEQHVHGYFDIILGADIVYEPPHALWVAHTIKRYLAQDGVALVLNAVRDMALLDSFLASLDLAGLECAVTDCEPECALSEFGIDWVHASETSLQAADYYVGGFKLMQITHASGRARHFDFDR